MPNALILTNHLFSFTGSEIVSLEVAETLTTLGFKTRIHTNFFDEKVRKFSNSRIEISDGDIFPNVFDFDVVWAQHNLLPICLKQHGPPTQIETRFFSVHLSPFEPFEHTGITTGMALGATFLANSEETANKLRQMTNKECQIVNFHNACPDRYWQSSEQKNALEKILVVSNHVPQEVLKFLDHPDLDHISKTIVGDGHLSLRVSPRVISMFDAVITIGKTVQYAIFSGKPVFCYDKFGGPGWLSFENIRAAEACNFSGRCSATKLPPEKMANAFLDGFLSAQTFIYEFRNHVRQKYSLDFLLKNLTMAEITTSADLVRSFYASGICDQEYSKSILQRRLYREVLELRHRVPQVGS